MLYIYIRDGATGIISNPIVGHRSIADIPEHSLTLSSHAPFRQLRLHPPCYRDTSTANRKTQQAQNDLNPPRSTSALIPCTRLLLYPRAHASIGRASRDQTCPPVTKPSRDLVDESARARLSPVRRTLRADHNGFAAQSAQRDGAHRERAHPSRARPQGRL